MSFSESVTTTEAFFNFDGGYSVQGGVCFSLF